MEIAENVIAGTDCVFQNLLLYYNISKMEDIVLREQIIQKQIIFNMSDLLNNYILQRCMNGEMLIQNHYINRITRPLIKQIVLAYSSFQNIKKDVCKKKANGIVRNFICELPNVCEYLKTDIESIYNNDPAAIDKYEIVIAYPGVFAICIYRLAHELSVLGVPYIPRIMTEYAHAKTGIDIHPNAIIGSYFCIDHGTGIVIGETTIIGNHVTIYHNVTLGAFTVNKSSKIKNVKRHPTIEDNVTIYTGATILGGQTVVGCNSIIGCRAVITESLPYNSKIQACALITNKS